MQIAQSAACQQSSKCLSRVVQVVTFQLMSEHAQKFFTGLTLGKCIIKKFH